MAFTKIFLEFLRIIMLQFYVALKYSLQILPLAAAEILHGV